ncbi:MAG: PrsW family intramembrane metalloprotease [Paludibacteraceae bacterium]|nr:PrsW family intramembrane metalloprotease [Paludibacteraceae bacterium]
MIYTIIFAAILPAFLLVLYIWLRDKWQREPLSQIVKGVLYGVFSAGIAMLLEGVISGLGFTPETHSIIGGFWKAFVGAAMPEEAAKLLMLWLLLRNNPYFDERFDGIVYACCVGMGFAGTENILYLISNINEWESVAVSRAIFAVPGHFMFAVVMGYYYSQVAFRDLSFTKRSRIFWMPVILHGIYDGLLFAAQAIGTEEYASVTGVLILCFYIFVLWMFRHGRKRIKEQSEADDPNKIQFF